MNKKYIVDAINHGLNLSFIFESVVLLKQRIQIYILNPPLKHIVIHTHNALHVREPVSVVLAIYLGFGKTYRSTGTMQGSVCEGPVRSTMEEIFHWVLSRL